MTSRSLPASRSLAAVRYIEVETSRYCNRTCSWCPNGHTRARTRQELLPWKLFEKITGELGELGYGGFFAFHNYNEPLANARLLDEVSHLRATVPTAKPAIYTNGDRLGREMFEELTSVGVSYLRVTRYPQQADTQPTVEALQHYLRIKNLTHLPWRIGEVRQGLAASYKDRATGMKAEVIVPNIYTYNDRGGTAEVPIRGSRVAPCRMTATSISVTYRGEVKMCCNVVPEGSQHQEYVVGNIRHATLAELYGSPQMTGWRKRHASADWAASPACATCVQALPETRK
ncbi:MoaA/NifB/PqqE/SkfB family radical SAM enzyme [Kitasatospora sp. MAP12-15]|uniref:radical SAM/SPASM domain-containing protein n=1 Tax=unclassified Kitasatospora TaxID=2633591 RepID=UPI002472F84B|nr:radical SAM/SPASM domain-containing protein [Kitasatospora sp. MAP12-44]MDH6111392.1 MoaA/NifB/PqqE/SkfB family radical SAM enzyme [Kitasatospora sp. MAP12-44]